MNEKSLADAVYLIAINHPFSRIRIFHLAPFSKVIQNALL
jgi:hypothetical protein